MKKIICHQCGNKWYGEHEDVILMQSCPYCGQALRGKPDMSGADTLDKAIYQALCALGTESLAKPRQLSGYLMDTAPQFKKELRVFSKALTDQYCQIIYRASRMDAALAEQEMRRLRTALVEEDGMSENWADLLCSSYLGAIRYTQGIGMEAVLLVAVEDYDVAPKPASKPKPVPKPQPEPEDNTPAREYTCWICKNRYSSSDPSPRCPLCGGAANL